MESLQRSQLLHEKGLLQLVAQGDHHAFQEIFEVYADKMYAVVYNYTKSTFIAEELTQEVFIRLWRQRHVLSEVEDPRAYLYRMVFNQINTYLKKAANELRILENAARRGTDRDNGTEHYIRANEMAHIIALTIDRLPPQKKTIYRLSREQGLNCQEIAERLNLSPNTVKNHLVQALKLLRGYLKDHALELSIFMLFTTLY